MQSNQTYKPVKVDEWRASKEWGFIPQAMERYEDLGATRTGVHNEKIVRSRAHPTSTACTAYEFTVMADYYLNNESINSDVSSVSTV